MGGNGSKARNVSFGLDEEEKVTVVEGVKLSEDVLRRMRESQGSERVRPSSLAPDSHKTSPSVKPAEPSASETQEEIRKNYERQQALVQEQLAKLAQRERETAAVTDMDRTTPAVIMEKWRTHEEQEKAKLLAKRLEWKEQELATVSSFYKEQLEILEKKNFENYKQTAEQYCEAATKTEAWIRPRYTASLCTELQARVLECYRENPQQTLHCSSLAKQYMNCVQQAKKSTLTNHG
ncbi:coiled-coil-helix-coiled-coil-helix domain containing 6b isoform X2 [Girardinichthys multiradiatus]|uniref:coiled-coil-helix-coiled-coil-helix domain containing 6b isoform X2 n=1 Tax=Girardinichthys multiradiatus TaxID=208333 RepID=UPI001FAE1745|nr:coiled-coil-helix-coiled-coil-helix domain containing 6b isoform X2 [Girardinichthys multiradiatus]